MLRSASRLNVRPLPSSLKHSRLLISRGCKSTVLVSKNTVHTSSTLLVRRRHPFNPQLYPQLYRTFSTNDGANNGANNVNDKDENEQLVDEKNEEEIEDNKDNNVKEEEKEEEKGETQKRDR